MTPARTSHGALAARAGLATVEVVGFSAYAHTQAGGRAPDVGQLLWIGLAAFAGCVLLLAGRARVRTVVGALTVLQVILHGAYAMLGTDAAHHHGMAQAYAAADAPGIVPGREMLVAHALTAVITTLALLAQEYAVRSLAAVTSLRLPRVAPFRAGPAARPVVLPARRDVIRTAPRRGPPRELPAAS